MKVRSTRLLVQPIISLERHVVLRTTLNALGTLFVMSKLCHNDVTMVTALVSSSLTHKMSYYKCHITNVIL